MNRTDFVNRFFEILKSDRDDIMKKKLFLNTLKNTINSKGNFDEYIKELETPEKIASKKINYFKGHINSIYCILDTIPIKTKILGDYLLGNITDKELKEYLEELRNLILEIYDKYTVDGVTKNLNFNKSIRFEVMECYKLKHNLDDITPYPHSRPKGKAKNTLFYSGLNGVYEVTIYEDKSVKVIYSIS